MSSEVVQANTEADAEINVESFLVTAEDIVEIQSSNRGVLPPNATATVYVGENLRAFRVSVAGTINNAKLAVFLQGKQVVVLTQTNTSTIVEGTNIQVKNLARRPQVFIAVPV